MRFLGALIDNTPPSVFENDAMGLVLRVMWYYHLRKWFLLDVFVYAVFYALWIVYVDWTASTTVRATMGIGIPERAIAGTLIALNTLYGLKEAVQSARSGRRAAYFRSPWNVVDFACILLVYAYVLSTVVRGGAGSGYVPLIVFTTFFLTLKLLAYLRGFGDTVSRLKEILFPILPSFSHGKSLNCAGVAHFGITQQSVGRERLLGDTRLLPCWVRTLLSSPLW